MRHKMRIGKLIAVSLAALLLISSVLPAINVPVTAQSAATAGGQPDEAVIYSSGRLAQSTQSAEEAVDAKIEIVWPNDGKGHVVTDLNGRHFVNVVVYLFERGTLNPVSCGFDKKVTLRWVTNPATHGGIMIVPAHDIPGQIVASAVGGRVMKNEGGKTFPAWEFNNLPMSGKAFFFVEVEGVYARSNVWAHATDTRTFYPFQNYPSAVGGNGPTPIDAFIQIVYPHGGAPVTEASLANIGVDLGQHTEMVDRFPYTWESVGFDFNRPVRLLRSLNDGYLEPVKTADGVITMTESERTWPRWMFNDVDVSAARDPHNKYYFAVQVEGAETHTTIWAHGADARTYFPIQDVPACSCR